MKFSTLEKAALQLLIIAQKNKIKPEWIGRVVMALGLGKETLALIDKIKKSFREMFSLLQEFAGTRVV